MFFFSTGASSDKRPKEPGKPSLLNKAGFHVGRKKLAHLLAATRRLVLGLFVPAVQRKGFDAHGFVVLENFLSPEHLAALKAEIISEAWPVVEMTQPPANTMRVNLDTQLCGERFPALGKLISHRPLLRLLRYAAGYPGTPIISLQIIRTDGVEAGHDPQTDWHSDTFHSVAKAWLFLHDVPADQGPFGYIPGSHHPTDRHWAWEHEQSITAQSSSNPMHAKGSFRVAPEELAAMGYGEPFVAAVPGNTLVVADTGGFHRRTPSQKPTVRIEVYLTLRRNPFLAGLVPSLLSLPIVRSHWAGWAYRYFEWLVAKGTPGWIPIGKRALKEDERGLLMGTSPALSDEALLLDEAAG
jgi:hypothetical protein